MNSPSLLPTIEDRPIAANGRIARAFRPQQQALSHKNNTRRTYLMKADAEGEPLGPVETVLDLFQQVSPYNPGRNLREVIEDFVEILGVRAACVALLKARNTHRRARVGLVYRFRSICEALVKEREAQEEKRIAEYEALMEKRQARFEAELKARADLRGFISRAGRTRSSLFG